MNEHVNKLNLSQELIQFLAIKFLFNRPKKALKGKKSREYKYNIFLEQDYNSVMPLTDNIEMRGIIICSCLPGFRHFKVEVEIRGLLCE